MVPHEFSKKRKFAPKSRFNPDSVYIENATQDFLNSNGEIKFLESVQTDYTYFTGETHGSSFMRSNFKRL